MQFVNFVLNNIELVLLIITFVISVYMMFVIAKLKKETSITNMFFITYFLIFIWQWCLILQMLWSNKYSINKFKFEYIAAIGTCFLPISIYYLAKVFINKKYTFKPKDLIMFIIPVVSLFILWTNDRHNLFYILYSTRINSIVYGPYFYVHIIYTYLLIFISVIQIWKDSIDKTGVFSRQSWFLFLGTIIPILFSILSWLRVLDLSIYFIPVFVSVGVICLLITMTKIKIVTIKKIALNKIMDLISDAFVVFNEKNVIIDYNKAFEKAFKLEEFEIQNENLFDLIEKSEYPDLNSKKDYLNQMIQKAIDNKNSIRFEYKLSDIDKYFQIEIDALSINDKTKAVIIIFRDITQHKNDIKDIKKNQEIIVEQDRLASLGQLIGGIAHNLKTPIMSIAGNLQGLEDLVEEYNLSIRDPQVTLEDHDDIAKDMKQMIQKANVHLEYMSNIITTVKGQAINSNIDKRETFTALEVISAVDILMKHELKQNQVQLKIELPETYKDIRMKGQMNNLVQVINNLVQNSIYSYKDQEDKTIYLLVQKEEGYIVFGIKDHGCGIDDNAKDKIFKEMITTKGKEGTGLGLYMSYSTIKGKYNGMMSFETKVDKGTTFYVKIPIYN